MDHFGIVTQGDALGLLGSHRWCWDEMGGFFGSHRWCWEEIGGFFHDLALGGESADFFLVLGKGEAFVERTGDLALEFADTPLIGGGFDFIKSAFVREIVGEEFDVVGPTEGEAAEEIFH
ncbi:MAG: hypothetical protein WCP38_05575 [Chloroflexota bacterium]